MSHHLQQESQQQQQQHQHQPQAERGRQHNHRGGGLMDLRNLCQRLDVDSLKAKLPALPQLKLPKSLPKLRAARRIFRSSHDKAASDQGAAAARGVEVTGGLQPQSQQQPQHAAQFINRTPQRISTISSLLHEQTTEEQQQQVSRHQLQQPSGATYCSAGSLDDDYYAPYGSNMSARVSRPISPIKLPATTATAAGEQQQQQRGTLTQRLQRGYKSLSELRLKHLFAKQTTVRRDNIEVQHYVEQYEAERRLEQMAQARRDREIADNYDIHISTVPITRQNTLKQQQQHLGEHSGDESGLETPPPPPAAAVARKKQAGGIAATRFAKVRQPPLQMPLEGEEQHEPQPQSEPETVKQPMRQAVRQNLKRLRKSIKRRRASSNQPHDSDEDEEQQAEVKQRPSAASNMRARLKRFASSEQLQQRWRKSFKAAGVADEQAAAAAGAAAGAAAAGGGGGGVAAQLERHMARLNEKMQQLKFFQRRSQQQQQLQQGNKPNTVGREPVEIDDDEELPATYHHSDSDGDGDDSDDSGQDVCAEDTFGQLEQPKQSSAAMLVKHQTLATLAQLQAHASTAWSSESLEEDVPPDEQHQQQQPLASTASDYPRVLIHQQHTDAYESTLIIAVTTTPPTPSPPSSSRQPPQWLPNEQIIAGFKEQQQQQQQQSQQTCWPAPMLYKAKSIDIFEGGDGGAAAAFADFDEALRNAPVLRISAGSSCDSNTEDADDSSSRVTRIRVQTPRIGNSCESLMEQQPLEHDEFEEEAKEEEQEQEQEDEEEEQEQQEAESERPPSVSPPPPPLPQRRPPPPTTMAPIYDAVPPPLPISKPPTIATTPTPTPTATATTAPATATPIAAAVQPIGATTAAALSRQPLRSASMTRPAKPLVKTSSLRLTYNEQMHPSDVGKVNKLISRFGGRPRLGARRLHSEELTICSDGDDESEELPEEPATPTPTNVKRSNSSNNNNNIIPDIVTTEPQSNNNNNNEETMQLDRHNSNCSRSEYGSPLSYPTQQQLNANTTTTATSSSSGRAGRARAPQPQPQPQTQSQLQSQSLLLQRRSRRSMTRDDDNFYSFDSDEENSYYSISPSSSSRYVVEI